MDIEKINECIYLWRFYLDKIYKFCYNFASVMNVI